MIIVSAVMHPHGNAAKAYEILHATVENRTLPNDKQGERYYSHVTARPSERLGIEGYDADVLITQHRSQDGFAPLLVAALNAAHLGEQRVFCIPPARTAARLTLADVTDFERALVSRRAA